MWLVSKGRLQCQANLFKKKIVTTPSCEVCQGTEETTDHILLHCPFARDFWNALGLLIADDMTLHDMQSLSRIQATFLWNNTTASSPCAVGNYGSGAMLWFFAMKTSPFVKSCKPVPWMLLLGSPASGKKKRKSTLPGVLISSVQWIKVCRYFVKVFTLPPFVPWSWPWVSIFNKIRWGSPPVECSKQQQQIFREEGSICKGYARVNFTITLHLNCLMDLQELSLSTWWGLLYVFRFISGYEL